MAGNLVKHCFCRFYRRQFLASVGGKQFNCSHKPDIFKHLVLGAEAKSPLLCTHEHEKMI